MGRGMMEVGGRRRYAGGGDWMRGWLHRWRCRGILRESSESIQVVGLLTAIRNVIRFTWYWPEIVSNYVASRRRRLSLAWRSLSGEGLRFLSLPLSLRASLLLGGDLDREWDRRSRTSRAGT